MQVTKSFIELNGEKIYYEIRGKGSPIVLIHGGLMDTKMWEYQFEFFSKHYKVICYDVRGFGKSDIPQRPFSHHQDLYALLNQLKISKAFVLGLSMGGAIAIDFTLEHPEMVSALILAAPSVSGFKYSNELMEKSLALFLAAREKSGAQALQMLFNDPFWNYFVPSTEFPNARKLFKEIVKENTRIFFIDPNLNQPLEPSAVERLSEIKIPTLIISAERDHSDNTAVAALLGERINGAKTIEISGVGHMVNMEKPEEFNKIVYNFLSNL